MRGALLTTRLYATSRPHALRELAIISAMEGKESRARRAFEQSLALAQQQEAVYEVARTQLAFGEAGVRFGWPKSEQRAESAR